MEISIEKLVIADPTIVDANPDIEENEGSDNEEAIVETGEAGTAPKKRNHFRRHLYKLPRFPYF